MNRPCALRQLLIVSLICFACGSLFAAEDESPLKSAKPGDWTEYQQVTEEKGKKIPQVVKRTALKKDSQTVTVKEEGTLNGQRLPSHERELFFDEPYNYLPQPPLAKIEKLSEGLEKVSLNGKDYACRWVQLKLTGSSGKFDAAAKVWLSPDVPLSGVVKFEMSVTQPLKGSIKGELSNSGRGK
jgi:hypothetical protein